MKKLATAISVLALALTTFTPAQAVDRGLCLDYVEQGDIFCQGQDVQVKSSSATPTVSPDYTIASTDEPTSLSITIKDKGDDFGLGRFVASPTLASDLSISVLVDLTGDENTDAKFSLAPDAALTLNGPDQTGVTTVKNAATQCRTSWDWGDNTRSKTQSIHLYIDPQCALPGLTKFRYAIEVNNLGNADTFLSQYSAWVDIKKIVSGKAVSLHAPVIEYSYQKAIKVGLIIRSSDPWGYQNVTKGWKWARCTKKLSASQVKAELAKKSGSSCKFVAGEVTQYYLVTKADKGKYLAVQLSAGNINGISSTTTATTAKVPG